MLYNSIYLPKSFKYFAIQNIFYKPSEIDLYIHWLAPADVQNDLYLALEMEAI